MWQAISRSLTGDFEMRKRFIDGSNLENKATEFVLANKTLSSFERLEIYNQQYWYRILDCFGDDFPGLKAVLGERRFSKLAKEYLSAHPSRSFSLRNLGENLAPFLETRADLVDPDSQLCLEMARFEWSRIVAFDEGSRTPIDQEYLKNTPPDKLTFSLQPYITLLELNYALDEYTTILNRHQRDRSEAGGSKPDEKRSTRKAPWPVQEELNVVVHRHENTVYLKRVDRPAFLILSALASGQTLTDAVADAVFKLEEAGMEYANLETEIQNWFALWMRLGWLCEP